MPIFEVVGGKEILKIVRPALSPSECIAKHKTKSDRIDSFSDFTYTTVALTNPSINLGL